MFDPGTRLLLIRSWPKGTFRDVCAWVRQPKGSTWSEDVRCITFEDSYSFNEKIVIQSGGGEGGGGKGCGATTADTSIDSLYFMLSSGSRCLLCSDDRLYSLFQCIVCYGRRIYDDLVITTDRRDGENVRLTTRRVVNGIESHAR